MKKTIIATALLALTATSFTIPASAAPVRAETSAAATLDVTKIHSSSRKHWHKRPARHQVLSPRQITRKLQQNGYRNVQRVTLRNGRYVVRARGYRGPVQLVVNARTGAVLSREVLRQPRRDHNPRYRHRDQRTGFSFQYSFR